MQGSGGLSIFRILGYIGWEMVHRDTQHLVMLGLVEDVLGRWLKSIIASLGEVMGGVGVTDLPRGLPQCFPSPAPAHGGKDL